MAVEGGAYHLYSSFFNGGRLGVTACLGYAIEAIKRDNVNAMYQIYVTDALKIIAENTAKSVKDGMALQKRYAELVEQVKNPPKPETRTAEEIINQTKATINMIGGNDSG